MTEFQIQMFITNFLHLLNIIGNIGFFVIMGYLIFEYFKDGIINVKRNAFYVLAVSILIIIFVPTREQHFATMLEKDRESSYMTYEERDIVTRLFNNAIK